MSLTPIWEAWERGVFLPTKLSSASVDALDVLLSAEGTLNLLWLDASPAKRALLRSVLARESLAGAASKSMARPGRVSNDQSTRTATRKREPMERKHDCRVPVVYQSLHGLPGEPPPISRRGFVAASPR